MFHLSAFIFSAFISDQPGEHLLELTAIGVSRFSINATASAPAKASPRPVLSTTCTGIG
jgi:hypothetical protein